MEGKMKKLLIAAAVLILAGCAEIETQKIMQWAEPARAEARAGTMLWSDYYTGLYDRIAAIQAPIGGKGFYLQATSTLIDISKSYEAGKISHDEFRSAQRMMTAKEAEFHEQYRMQQSQAAAAAYSQFLYSQSIQAQTWAARTPQFTNCQQMGNSVSCTSY
jgi:uncharacterized protein YceK